MELIRFSALSPGPRLLILGAVHGNEPCGPTAIRRAVDDVRGGTIRLLRGAVTFVPVVNAKAFLQNTREGDRNLNRDLHESVIPRDNEERVANLLCPLLRTHDALLDLHSFKSHGEPFVFAGPDNNSGPLEPFALADAEQAFAAALGVDTLLRGWLDTYAAGFPDHPTHGVGTTEYMRYHGGMAVTLECGNHLDPASPEVAYAAIRNALAHFGMSADPVPAPGVTRRIRLTKVFVAEDAGDALVKPWRTFDRVTAGEPVAVRASGEILAAPADGYVIFPNAAPTPGASLFYIAVDE
jgi:predicted deacylase